MTVRRSRSVIPIAMALAVQLSIVGCGSLPSAPPRPADPGIHLERGAASPDSSPVVELLAAARTLLGKPYREAATGPRAFDCSGLTSYLFDALGLELPRTAAAQAEVGGWVPLDELRAGDLVFFADRAARPHHVGLVVSRPGEPLTMIHASTSSGVVETVVTASTYWLQRLAFGRRVLAGD